MSILSAAWTAIKAIGELLGVIKKQQDLNNSPAMQKADLAKKDAELRDHINETLKKEDTKETQTLLSD